MTQAQRDKLLIELNIGINGNGTKGLHDRVGDLEDWQKIRPQECPAKKPSRATILAQRAVEVSVLSFILALVLAIGKIRGWW